MSGSMTEINELDVVETLVPAETDEGYPLPAGSRGTVVDVYGTRDAYCVEFSDVLHPYGGLLADLAPSQVRLHSKLKFASTH